MFLMHATYATGYESTEQKKPKEHLTKTGSIKTRLNGRLHLKQSVAV
jgi:hypothetical protein